MRARAVQGALALLAAAVLLPGATSCQKSPTEMVFVVTTDLDCSKIKDSLAYVGTPATVDTRAPATTTTTCIAGKLGTLVVVPSGSESEEIAVRVVTGVGKTAEQCQADGFQGGCIVARRALRFLPETSVHVPIAMRGSCIDLPCSGGGELQTCVQGACVAATVSDPNACKGDGCDESVLRSGEGAGRDAGELDGSVADAAQASDAAASSGEGTWVPMKDPPVGFVGRASTAFAWTGTAMIVWGGDIDGWYANDGAAYDPQADSWTMLTSVSLERRTGHVGVFARELGSAGKFIVWGGGSGGGSYADGALYDVAAKAWEPMDPPGNLLSARSGSSAVWSGKEMIIWGGIDANDAACADGAAYDPTAAPGARWRKLAASPLEPRWSASAIWDGKKMHVYGGIGADLFGNAASYDPDADRQGGAAWVKLPDPINAPRAHAPMALIPRATGSPLSAFIGGGEFNLDVARSDGLLLDPDAAEASKWASIGPPPLNDAERLGSFVWYGAGRLWTWGGATVAPVAPGKSSAFSDGASYDVPTKSWHVMPSGGPSARSDGVAVWTGSRAIVWGGIRSTNDDAGSTATYLNDGMMFVPK